MFASEKFQGKSKAGLYGDTLEELDWSTGTILDFLQRTGLAKNTLVIFTNDNGPWYEGSPGHLRGRKGEIYDGGFRVPMIAWWPGHVPSLSICTEPVMNIDFLPTFLSLSGGKMPKDRPIDGKNIADKISKCPYLYDMKIDPGGNYNLASNSPKITEDLTQMMNTFRAQMGIIPQ